MSLTLKLGKAEYEIGDLSWGQVEELQELFEQLPIPATSRASNVIYRKMVLVALSEDYPGLIEETLRKSKIGTIQQIQAAVNSVLLFCGIFVAKEASPPGKEEGQE